MAQVPQMPQSVVVYLRSLNFVSQLLELGSIRIFGKVEGNIGKVEGDKKLGA